MRTARDHTRPRVVIPRATLFAALLALSLATAITAVAVADTRPGPSMSARALPDRFPQPRVPKNNPMSAEKAAVGRRLFYDSRLSGNGKESCSSCHKQQLAFTDGRAQSVGATGQLTPRNSPSLVNVAYNTTLTWANAALVTLEQQIEVPLFGEHPVEMGITDANKHTVLARLRKDPWYRRHMRRAFPGVRQPVNLTSIARAIATFQRTIISASSRYDRYLRGKTKLTEAQSRGRTLFMSEKTGCTHCHGSYLFNDQVNYRGAPDDGPPRFHNTGLYNIGGTGAYPAPNRGLFESTGAASDMGRFRAPSLRNVALTAPYMHDGSIKTLSEVIDFYAAGGRNITSGPYAGDGRKNPYLDPERFPIDLNARERADLVAFLKSLTDWEVVRAGRFSDPFAHRRSASK